MVEPAAARPGARALGGAGRARALRRRGGRDLPRLPRAARRGRPRGRGAVPPGAPSTHCASARRLGPHACVRLRLRRLHRARARRARDAGGARRAPTSSVSLPYERGRAGVQGGRPAVRGPARAGRATTSSSRRWTSTTPPSRATRSTTSSAASTTPPRTPADPGPPCGCCGRRRARRGRAGGRRGAGAAARRHRAGRHRGRVPRPEPLRRRSWSRCSAPTASRSRSTARVPLGHTPLGRGLLALLRCRRRRRAAPTTCSPSCARPASSSAPSWPTGSRPTCARRARAPPRRAARCGSERRWPLDEIDRLRDARGAGELLDALARGARAPVRRALPRARRTSSRAPSSTTPARSDGRDALAGLRKLAEAESVDGALDAARLHELLARLPVRLGERPQPDRVQVAEPEELRARRFEAVFVCGLQEGEFPRPAGGPSRSSPTTTAAQIAEGHAGCGCRCARTSSTASATCSTSAARAPSGCWCCRRASRDEEGNPQVPSFLVEDVRDLFGELPERARRGLLPTSPGRSSRRPRRWSGSAPRRSPARAWPTAGPAELTHERGARRAAHAGGLLGGRARGVRRLPGQVARGQAARPRGARAGPRAHGARQLRARGARAHLPAPARADRRAPRHAARTSRRPSASCSSAARVPQPSSSISPKETRVRAAVRRLEFDLLRYIRHEAAGGRPLRARRAGAGFGLRRRRRARRWRWRGVSCAARSTASTRWGESRSCATTRAARPCSPWPSGRRRTACRWRSTCSPCASCCELEPAGGVYVPLGGKDGGRAGSCAPSSRRSSAAASSTTTARPPRSSRSSCAACERDACAGSSERMRAGEMRPCPGQLLVARRLLVPLDLPGGTVSELAAHARAAARRSSAATARCSCTRARAAARRACWSSASCARCWTTACRWTGILAITFTEKAAAELKARACARRFVELGEREQARAAEGALGLDDPRLLRAAAARAPAGGRHRPRVPRARRGRAPRGSRSTPSTARSRTSSPTAREPGRLDLAAAYTPDKLRKMTTAVHGRLRSRGQRRPVLPELEQPVDGDERERLEAALADAGRALGRARGERTGGHRARQARALLRGARPGARRALGRPEEFEGARVEAGQVDARRDSGDYLEAHAAWLEACARQRAYADYVLLRQLLELYGAQLRGAQGAGARRSTSTTSS